MTTIEKLLGRLDWSGPELAGAKALCEAGNNEAAMEAVAEHFRTRTKPEYLFTRADMEKFSDPETIKDAEDTMNHYIYGYQFPGDIDWFFNPTADTSRDNEWSWSLFRHIYWQPLARAYVMTGDEKYTREFLAEMKSFYETWPADPFMEDPEYEKQFKFPGHAWRRIETGIRFYTTWMPCYVAFRGSKEWTAEYWAIFLNLVYDTAEYLMEHYSNHVSSSNWLTMEATSLFQCGVLFPELANHESWKVRGYERVMQETLYSFDDDGIHMERTPIYHMVSATSFWQALLIAEKNGVPVPEYVQPVIEKAASFVMSLVKPDFSTPMIGDADRNDLLTRRSDTSVYEGMNLSFDPLDLNEMRAWFRQLAERTGREDFRYFATGRSEGEAPGQRNFCYKPAGIYVMRTGWGPEDSYFHVHAVQLERGERSTHSHNDQGHLELQIKGEDVLIDSGRFIYNSSIWKDWRAYFLSAKAHNTLEIEDHVMGDVPGNVRIRGVRNALYAFREENGYQLVDFAHNGYVYTEDPIVHRRRVVRLEGDVVIVEDRLNGLGLKEHDLNLYFNFAPGELAEAGCEPAGEGLPLADWNYHTAKGTGFRVWALAEKPLAAEILKGSEEPKGGWVSYGYPVRQPIPQLRITRHESAPARFLTVFAPEGTEIWVVPVTNVEHSGAHASDACEPDTTLENYQEIVVTAKTADGRVQHLALLKDDVDRWDEE